MRYTHRVIVSIPRPVFHIGVAIARALDPDAGGALSFGGELQGDPAEPLELYSASFPCTQEFAETATLLMNSAAAMHHAVCTDYSLRWPELAPPSLEEVEMFLLAATWELVPPQQPSDS